MRIAQVAPLSESVPPQAYGGTERVVSYLTEALVAQGHEVTLYASGDSRTAAQLVSMCERGLRLDPQRPEDLIWHTRMLDRVFADAGDFDVIHLHTEVLHYPLARRCPIPCVTTLHSRLDRPGLAMLHAHFAELPLVSISESQRRPMPRARWCATVHHGLPSNLYAFHPQAQNYFAFVGRLSPEKRVERAVEIARACGMPLRIAAKIEEADRAYFDSVVRPLLDDPLVDFVGEIGDAAKNDFIGHARALLFPIDWPEPFGLVMIEALACGTPVLAWRCGSVPEVLEHGVSGWIVDDMEAAIDAARRVDLLDRRACRRTFDRRFTASHMAHRYLAVYRELAARTRQGSRLQGAAA